MTMETDDATVIRIKFPPTAFLFAGETYVIRRFQFKYLVKELKELNKDHSVTLRIQPI
jgi:hypothetical protein